MKYSHCTRWTVKLYCRVCLFFFFCFKNIFKKFKILFYFFPSICFCVFRLFLCVDVKNNFLNKNIILIHFRIKITLKSKRNHTPKHF
jgi:hypothetical protein